VTEWRVVETQPVSSRRPTTEAWVLSQASPPERVDKVSVWRDLHQVRLFCHSASVLYLSWCWYCSWQDKWETSGNLRTVQQCFGCLGTLDREVGLLSDWVFEWVTLRMWYSLGCQWRHNWNSRDCFGDRVFHVKRLMWLSGSHHDCHGYDRSWCVSDVTTVVSCLQSRFVYRTSTRWFKYDRDKLGLVYTQISPGHIWTTLYISW
jgi:hypothetical protein